MVIPAIKALSSLEPQKDSDDPNLEPDVMQRAGVHHGAQDVGKLYFHQGVEVVVVVYSLQRAETSVRETALPSSSESSWPVGGGWGRRVTRVTRLS